MNTLLNQPLKVANAGLHSFADNIQHAGGGAIVLNWQLPTQSDIDAGLDSALLLHHSLVEDADQIAMVRYLEAQFVLVNVMLAKEAILAMTEQKRILHSGPSIAWEEMYGPVKGMIIDATLYEGWTINQQDAENQIDAGETDLTPHHHYHTVGPMTDIISPSMPLWVVENKTNDHRTFNNFNEGLGKALHFGADDDEVLNCLAQTYDELAPATEAAIAQHGELGPKPLMAQVPHTRDKIRNRSAAATGLLVKRLLPILLACPLPQEHIQCVVAFIIGNDHFFPNLSVATRRAMMDAVASVPFSSMATMMACNGVNFGIRPSGTGDHWFQAPANAVEGLLSPESGVDDAAADLGDNAVTETVGMGGFVTASSPAIVKLVGGAPVDVTDNSRRMQIITFDGNPAFILSALNFAPTAAGTDAHKVTDRGILPVINTGIVHKQAGVEQIGARTTTALMACFVAAIRTLTETVTKENHHG